MLNGLDKDTFGERGFYYYNEAAIREGLGDDFQVARLEHQVLNRKTARWLVILAQKK